MNNKFRFYVRPVWDEEAKVYYSESNIFGLHIEGETEEEFMDAFYEIAPEVIFRNYYQGEISARDLIEKPLKETLKGLFLPVLFERPLETVVTR